MPWTPARALGTLVFAGVTAGGALVLSSGRVETPAPTDVAAGPTTTARVAANEPTSSTTSSTTAPPSTTTTEPPLTGPVRLLPSSRFDLRGVGPVEARMTVHEAERATGVRFTLAPIVATAGRCSSATPNGVPGLVFVVAAPGGAAATDPKAGTIVRATATDPSFATVSNARVGSALAEARSIYAGRYEEVRFGRSGVALTVLGRSGADRDMGVRIDSVDGRQVTSLSSGLADALATPDGCA
ncbi:MAG TPA: hypothetical protein VM143_11770 [Acidimicrobiales bacterium]|nr:hypothetical protein [Acidimicrobiales bacterium]